MMEGHICLLLDESSPFMQNISYKMEGKSLHCCQNGKKIQATFKQKQKPKICFHCLMELVLFFNYSDNDHFCYIAPEYNVSSYTFLCVKQLMQVDPVRQLGKELLGYILINLPNLTWEYLLYLFCVWVFQLDGYE